MLDAYRLVLRQPGARALLIAGLPARLSLATYGIGLLALGRESYGSYAAGGALAAVYTVAAIVTGPPTGRWSTRRWYRSALAPLAIAHALAVALTVGLAGASAPPWCTTFAAASIGLLLPPAGVIARARWSATVNGRVLVSALFLESVLDEGAFIVGPTLITGVAAIRGAGVALLVAAVVTTLGCLGLAAVRPGAGTTARSGPSLGRRPPAVRGRTQRRVGLWPLCLAFLALGVVFASVQVAVIAFSGAHHASWQAGPVLLAFSAVSLAASAVAGVRGRSRPVAVRHRRAFVLLGLGLLPALLAPSPLVLALLLVPAAAAAAPAVAAGYARVGEVVGPRRAGEGSGWCAAALGAGLAAGSVGGGALADLTGSAAVLLLGSAAAAAGWVAARPAAARQGVGDGLRPAPATVMPA